MDKNVDRIAALEYNVTIKRWEGSRIYLKSLFLYRFRLRWVVSLANVQSADLGPKQAFDKLRINKLFFIFQWVMSSRAIPVPD